MADPAVPLPAPPHPATPVPPGGTPTNPAAKGLATSEGWLAVAVFMVGSALETGVIPELQHLHEAAPNSIWAILGLLGAGAALQAASLFGYTRGRTQVKQALIGAQRP